MLEPGLFEWLAWHPRGLPTFMTPDELKEAGLNVARCDSTTPDHNDKTADEGRQKSYKPIWTEWNIKESVTEYYERCHVVTRAILDRHKGE